MLKRINSIRIFFISILFFTGCSISNIPRSYRFNPRDIKKEITGNWIEVKTSSNVIGNPEIEVSGELIAIQSDTVFILTEVQLNGVQISKINKAILYIYNSRAGRYAAVTGLLYLPDIIAAAGYGNLSFLALGLPWLIAGSIIIFSEGSNSNVLIYPNRNRMEDFRKFARFPQGMPQGIIKEKLHLIITN
jgi:hypothetical protein